MSDRHLLHGPSDSRAQIADDLIRNVATRITVHDEPMKGAWLCGRCPYSNVGVVCTKCGAPRYEGQEIA